ncbi:MAG: hypothetical protein GMKNLPBB_02092 [Myxococcota bacterium]|nr:hypothetical protein [Myxococcota bacterium]
MPPPDEQQHEGFEDQGADVYRELLRLRELHQPCALATVIESTGSTPRKAGAKMLIRADGGITGSIGGGAIENQIIQAATDMIRRQAPPAMIAAHLTRDLGMCCGGTMRVFIEPQLWSPRLIILGGGHVAKPLCEIAAITGFAITVVDGREEFSTPERFPRASAVENSDPDDYARRAPAADGAFVVVVTHDHALDQRVLEALLKRNPAWIGMIGSRAKWVRFAQRLDAKGYSADQLARVHTPVGLDIGAVTPEEIAVSITAQLVARRRRIQE